MKLNTAPGLVQLRGILGLPILLFNSQQGPTIWDTWSACFDVGFSCDWLQLPSPISQGSCFHGKGLLVENNEIS